MIWLYIAKSVIRKNYRGKFRGDPHSVFVETFADEHEKYF